MFTLINAPIHHMTNSQMIAKIERDEAAVYRAASVLADNAALQVEVARLKRELSDARSIPARVVVKKVPGPVRTVEKRVDVPGPVKTVTKRVEVPGPVRTVTKNVPTPCPKQSEEIKALQAKLSTFEKYDMKRFRKWCKMVDVAEGRK